MYLLALVLALAAIPALLFYGIAVALRDRRVWRLWAALGLMAVLLMGLAVWIYFGPGSGGGYGPEFAVMLFLIYIALPAMIFGLCGALLGRYVARRQQARADKGHPRGSRG
ncbi:MAG: hypothetical protein Q4G25_07505 [Paracoccus sp. (in: a-proteobacteria)]|nr:hypothetical protein [Paracoccus sp. (in: a-proteobacteria)]